MNKPSGAQGDFLAEASLALDDLGDGIVAEKQLSKCLNNPNDVATAYLNIRSNANKEFCIELTQHGYRVVGLHFNDNSQKTSAKYYESLQALLTNESKSYVDSFAHSLQEKLYAAQTKIQQDRENDDDDDDKDLS